MFPGARSHKSLFTGARSQESLFTGARSHESLFTGARSRESLFTGARSHKSVLLILGKFDNKVDFLLICVSGKCHFSMNILRIFCGL